MLDYVNNYDLIAYLTDNDPFDRTHMQILYDNDTGDSFISLIHGTKILSFELNVVILDEIIKALEKIKANLKED